MKKLLFGILWTVVIYFGTCMTVGAIVGAIAGSKPGLSQADIQYVAQAAAEKAVSENLLLIAAWAVLSSALGSVAGILPGTGDRRIAAEG